MVGLINMYIIIENRLYFVISESRIGVDKIEDEVELAMVREVDCITDYQQRMKMLIETMIKQVDANIKAQKKLDTDIKNKVKTILKFPAVK